MKKLALSLLALIALGIGYMGVAYADDAGSGSAVVATDTGSAVDLPSVVTPHVDAPAPSLSTAEDLYKSGQWLCLGIVVVFLLAQVAAKRWSWLQAPSRLHYVTAVLAGLALIAVPASQGATPTLKMVLSALGGVAATFLPGLGTATAPKA